MSGPLEHGVRAAHALSLHLTSSLMQQAGRGWSVERVVNTFSRNRQRLLSGVLGGAGVAGGAWAAVSVWSSSLGAWGGLAGEAWPPPWACWPRPCGCPLPGASPA